MSRHPHPRRHARRVPVYGWLLLAGSLLALTAGVAWLASAAPAPAGSATSFERVGGGQVDLVALHGNVVMLNVWATWCPPCRAELPTIQKVYEAYKDQGLVVVGLNATYEDDAAQAVTVARSLGLTFPVALDRGGAIDRAHSLQGLPTTFFIDRKGTIRNTIVGGPMAEATMRTNVENLLTEGP